MARPGYKARTIVVTPDRIFLGHISGGVDTYNSQPGEPLTTTLPAILARAADVFAGEGVLLIDPGPAWPTLMDRYRIEADAVRAAGWTFPGDAPEPWTSFKHGARPTVHLGVLGAMKDQRGHIFRKDEDRWAICKRLADYHELVGVAYRMSLGTTGCALLRSLHTDPERGRQPYWGMNAKPRTDDDGRAGAGDLQGWQREPIPRERRMKYAHKYDANAARLAAALNAEPAYRSLKHLTDDFCTFDFTMHGYWLIPADSYVRPPWFPPAYDHRMARTGTIWVTTPTMVYLYSRGVKPPVLDAYAAPGRRWLRTWAERLDAARKTAMSRQDERLTGAVKGTYKETFGMMERPGGSVSRFDVSDEVYDLGRCNLIRRSDRIHAATKALPMRVHTDEMWYPSDNPDPLTAVPGFTQGVNLGQVKVLTIPMADYMDGRRK